MKKVIVWAIVCLAINNSVSSMDLIQKDRKRHCFLQDTLVVFLSTLNLAQFENKPIDSLIAKLPVHYTNMRVLGGSRDDRAGKLLINYSNNVYIIIRVLEFTHLDPTNPNKIPPDQRWSTTLMRKEKIYSIRIFNGTNLINHFNED